MSKTKKMALIGSLIGGTAVAGLFHYSLNPGLLNAGSFSDRFIGKFSEFVRINYHNESLRITQPKQNIMYEPGVPAILLINFKSTNPSLRPDVYIQDNKLGENEIAFKSKGDNIVKAKRERLNSELEIITLNCSGQENLPVNVYGLKSEAIDTCFYQGQTLIPKIANEDSVTFSAKVIKKLMGYNVRKTKEDIREALSKLPKFEDKPVKGIKQKPGTDPNAIYRR